MRQRQDMTIAIDWNVKYQLIQLKLRVCARWNGDAVRTCTYNQIEIFFLIFTASQTSEYCIHGYGFIIFQPSGHLNPALMFV